jgi:hypothetical protein
VGSNEPFGFQKMWVIFYHLCDFQLLEKRYRETRRSTNEAGLSMTFTGYYKSRSPSKYRHKKLNVLNGTSVSEEYQKKWKQQTGVCRMKTRGIIKQTLEHKPLGEKRKNLDGRRKDGDTKYPQRVLEQTMKSIKCGEFLD